MKLAREKVVRLTGSLLVSAGFLFFGFLIAMGGRQVLLQWTSIHAMLAAVGIVWIVAGPVMLLAGLGAAVTLGRSRIPMLAGGLAAVLAGTVLIVGVLTYVIPCSGPS